MENTPGPNLTPAARYPAPLAVLSQILAIVFGSLAMLWGFFCVYLAAFPGPCGDNPGPGLGVLEAWVLDVPVGLLMLATGWFIKKGLPWMGPSASSFPW
jgi:hypothetical protein